MAQHDQPRMGSLEPGQVQRYAAYGKACLNCARSKTRCTGPATGGKCERCHRLNKDCQSGPTVRQKRISKRSASTLSSKTAALEERLDGIVQMLQRSQASISGIGQPQEQIQNNSFDSMAFADRAVASSVASDAGEISRCIGNAQANIGCGEFPTANNLLPITSSRLDEIAGQNQLTSLSKVGQEGLIQCPGNGPPTPATSITGSSSVPEGSSPPNDYPLESEAELKDCLDMYRTKMVQYFPIVCIRPEVTVEELRNERPFLFLVIRAVCSKNLARQGALVLQVKEAMGREMLLEGTKSLDLFFGILVFATWCQSYICHKPIISTIIHLGISLAFDLGLTRPLPTKSVNVMLHYNAQGCPKPIYSSTLARTMEERRAAVGLWLIISVSANYFQRIELMRWTPYLDECLSLLEEKDDYPTDLLLVYLVRVQLICNRSAASLRNEIFGDAGTQIPADFYVKILKSQLDDLERSIPLELKSNVTLQLHILSTNLSIHEHSLSATPRFTSSDPTNQLQRVENLWICFNTIKSWFNIYLCLEVFPLSSYPEVSMALFTQMSHCFVALFRLSTFESPDVPWDRRRVRQQLGLGDIVKTMAERWGQVPSAAGMERGPPGVVERGLDQWNNQWNGDPWSHAEKITLGIGNWWEAKVAAMTAADAERESRAAATINGALDGSGLPGQQQMDSLEFGTMHVDMLDDAWMRDLLGGGYDFNLEPYF